MTLTKEEISNIRIYLSRVDIKGAEAKIIVDLQVKLGSMLQELERPKETAT